MNGMFKRILAGITILGLALWGPGLPLALAQVDFASAEIVAGCQAIEDPAIREIVLSEVLPVCQEQPEGQEARIVETTAVAIHEATETTRQALEDPEAVTQSTVTVLANNGVPPEVVARVEAQMREALTRASESLRGGGTLEDTIRYLEVCRNAMAECSPYLGDRDFREIFVSTGGPGGWDRPEYRSMEFFGDVIDPTRQDIMGGYLEAHFNGMAREMIISQPGGRAPSPEDMRRMVEQMGMSGCNPGEIFRQAYRDASMMVYQGERPYGGPGGTVMPDALQGIEGLTPDQIAAITRDGGRRDGTTMGFVGRDEMRALGLTDDQIMAVEARAGYSSTPYGGNWEGGPSGGFEMPRGWHFDEHGNLGYIPPSDMYGPSGGNWPAGDSRMAPPPGDPATWSPEQRVAYYGDPAAAMPNWDGAAARSGMTYGDHTYYGGGGWDPATSSYSGGTTYGGGWDPATSSYSGGTTYGGGWDPATSSTSGWTYEGGTTSGTTTTSGGTTTTENHNYDYAQEAWHGCEGFTESEKTTHRAHAHCNSTD